MCVCFQINEVRKLIGPQSGKLALYCSDASIARYLRARNWNVKKAVKMLKASLKWRSEYKPEEIRWVTKNLYFYAHQLSINLIVSCLDLVFYFHFAEVEAFMHCPSIDFTASYLLFNGASTPFPHAECVVLQNLLLSDVSKSVIRTT